MNAFYERLNIFGASVNHASEESGQPLGELFTLVHPSYPVISQPRSIIPEIEFEDNCPPTLRKQVRRLLRKAFRRQVTA